MSTNLKASNSFAKWLLLTDQTNLLLQLNLMICDGPKMSKHISNLIWNLYNTLSFHKLQKYGPQILSNCKLYPHSFICYIIRIYIMCIRNWHVTNIWCSYKLKLLSGNGNTTLIKLGERKETEHGLEQLWKIKRQKWKWQTLQPDAPITKEKKKYVKFMTLCMVIYLKSAWWLINWHKATKRLKALK